MTLPLFELIPLDDYDLAMALAASTTDYRPSQAAFAILRLGLSD